MDNENQLRGKDPWTEAESRYQPEQKVQGIVTRVTQFGVFVQLEPGIEGILYGFELGLGTAALTRYISGQELQLYVKTVDATRKRLELSLQQELAPGLLADRSLPVKLQRQKRPADLPSLAEFPLPETLFKVDERNCPTCQQAIQRSWTYCVYCGGSLRRHCAACGNVQPDLPDARFCYECGQPL